MTISFQNQVAVVTGAGGGLGRTYALMLASKGAQVVVNDFGGSVKGDLNSNSGATRPADKVVSEIIASGGIAIANYDSVENGSKIIETAIKSFGKIDILINNAGILRDVSFGKMTEKDFDLIMEIHLKGTYNCCKAAWPHMQKQNYGRIIVTSSAAGLFGNFGQVNYSSAKSSLLGFGKSLAFEGARKNIFVNCIAPLAGTRMTETIMSKDLVDALRPQYVTPVVCYLVSKNCKENGSVFEIGAGWVAKVRHERSPGYFFPLNFSPENVETHWNEVINFSNTKKNTYPETLNDSITLVLDQVMNKSNNENHPQANEINSSKIFKMMDSYLKAYPKEGKAIVNKIGCIFDFNIKTSEVTPPNYFYRIDLKNGNGSIKEGPLDGADASFTLSDRTFVDMTTGKANPRMSVQKGLIKVKGNMSAMMKFNNSIFPRITEELLAMNTDDAILAYTQGTNQTSNSSLKETSNSSSKETSNSPKESMIVKLKQYDLKCGPIIENIMNQIEMSSVQKN
uniref:Hydroxysteroid 17-beta dehydrogenase 4 n=1 Tax=Nephromyces sp. MMRI TaxID=2496275 RepID=A0A3Q8UBM1_9APIC|nr:hydroxysteroid 17-beta dehydrogenase 4 [Nephromyces sp. MMRI]